MFKKYTRLGSIALLALTGVFALVACGGVSSSSEAPSTSQIPTSPYTVSVNVIGSSEIAVSKTVQLRSTVIGTTQKDVTWSSSNESIVTVDNRGLVTGVGAGSAQVRATLNLDNNAFADVTITVIPAIKPTSITINGSTSDTAWVGENYQLTITALPTDASTLVEWESSNEEVATVSQEGSLMFIEAGQVVITAISLADPTVYASINYDVKKGTFISNRGSANWDLSHQADTINPHIELPSDLSGGYNSTYFNHFTGTRFYIEANFKTGPLTGDAWAWQGIGVGTGLSDSDTRFFTFSPFAPNQGNNHNKTIVRDMPTTWGALTDRSQVWGEHGLNQIDSSQGVKIALLRDNNRYYYLINDQLHWVDETTKYDEINTYPIIVGFDIPVIVTDYLLISDSAEIDAKLSQTAYAKSFFTTGDVTYIDDSDFTFNTTTTLSKDHKVRSLGDKTKLYGNFEVSFDVENMVFNQERETFTGIGVNFVRYDSANLNESVLIGQSQTQENKANIVSRFQSWDYQKSMEDATGHIKWAESTTAVKADAVTKSRVVITRTIVEQKAIFSMTVDGTPVSFDLGSSATPEASVYYTGSYLMWIGGEYTSARVSNFVYSNQ